MLKKSQGRAWDVGVRFAIFWKKLQKALSDWDKRCVSWAEYHRLPAWSGHLPVITAIIVVIVGILIGGILISPLILFLWGASHFRERIDLNSSFEDEYEDVDKTGPGYRNGQDGYGYYSGSDDITSERED